MTRTIHSLHFLANRCQKKWEGLLGMQKSSLVLESAGGIYSGIYPGVESVCRKFGINVLQCTLTTVFSSDSRRVSINWVGKKSVLKGELSLS